jgi:methionine aminopeptidase
MTNLKTSEFIELSVKAHYDQLRIASSNGVELDELRENEQYGLALIARQVEALTDATPDQALTVVLKVRDEVKSELKDEIKEAMAEVLERIKNDDEVQDLMEKIAEKIKKGLNN